MIFQGSGCKKFKNLNIELEQEIAFKARKLTRMAEQTYRLEVR